ncbi:hypothetical protein [Aromatoleum toluclasticum]|uniref:hypothetical protein n=1 Tax=Aromatoleum toluclasticum TaxID=92003 RepID=UPI001D180840|nr:hypothetical protein [Aromatoleum toluclasticum]
MLAITQAAKIRFHPVVVSLRMGCRYSFAFIDGGPSTATALLCGVSHDIGPPELPHEFCGLRPCSGKVRQTCDVTDARLYELPIYLAARDGGLRRTDANGKASRSRVRRVTDDMALAPRLVFEDNTGFVVALRNAMKTDNK